MPNVVHNILVALGFGLFISTIGVIIPELVALDAPPHVVANTIAASAVITSLFVGLSLFIALFYPSSRE